VRRWFGADEVFSQAAEAHLAEPELELHGRENMFDARPGLALMRFSSRTSGYSKDLVRQRRLVRSIAWAQVLPAPRPGPGTPGRPPLGFVAMQERAHYPAVGDVGRRGLDRVDQLASTAEENKSAASAPHRWADGPCPCSDSKVQSNSPVRATEPPDPSQPETPHAGSAAKLLKSSRQSQRLLLHKTPRPTQDN